MKHESELFRLDHLSILSNQVASKPHLQRHIGRFYMGSDIEKQDEHKLKANTQQILYISIFNMCLRHWLTKGNESRVLGRNVVSLS